MLSSMCPTLSRWGGGGGGRGGLRALRTLRAMPAGALAPGRDTHAGEVKV